MGRKPCCEKEGVNRGAWSSEEDQILTQYIQTHGEGKWRDLPLRAGLNRCGKSCRLRWLNYLRPDIKRGNISAEEEELILRLHKLLGNRWSLIAGRLPGRTDNEIKNYWNTNLSKRSSSSSSSSDQDHQPSNNYNSKESTEVMKSNIPESSAEQSDHRHQGQVQVIRTKAFKCTKVAIPPHLHDHDHHQTVDSNKSTDHDQSLCSHAAAPPLKQEQDNSSSSSAGFDDDMLMDLDINELFISDDVLKGTKLDDLLMDIEPPLIPYQPNGDDDHHDDQDVHLNALISSFLNSENDDDMIDQIIN